MEVAIIEIAVFFAIINRMRNLNRLLCLIPKQENELNYIKKIESSLRLYGIKCDFLLLENKPVQNLPNKFPYDFIVTLDPEFKIEPHAILEMFNQLKAENADAIIATPRPSKMLTGILKNGSNRIAKALFGL